MSFILSVNILLSKEDCQALQKEPFRNSCAILFRQIRDPSQPDQSCSGKSGKLFQPDQSCSGKSGKPPSLINPAQASQAIRQTKEIREKSNLLPPRTTLSLGPPYSRATRPVYTATSLGPPQV